MVNLAFIEGEKMIVFGHHLKVFTLKMGLDGIEHKLGKAYRVMCIDSNISLYRGQSASCPQLCNCMHCGKVIVFGHHHSVLDRIEHKLGNACQAMCIDSNVSLYPGQSASCIQRCNCSYCRGSFLTGTCVWTLP